MDERDWQQLLQMLRATGMRVVSVDTETGRVVLEVPQPHPISGSRRMS